MIGVDFQIMKSPDQIARYGVFREEWEELHKVGEQGGGWWCCCW